MVRPSRLNYRSRRHEASPCCSTKFCMDNAQMKRQAESIRSILLRTYILSQPQLSMSSPQRNSDRLIFHIPLYPLIGHSLSRFLNFEDQWGKKFCIVTKIISAPLATHTCTVNRKGYFLCQRHAQLQSRSVVSIVVLFLITCRRKRKHRVERG